MQPPLDIDEVSEGWTKITRRPHPHFTAPVSAAALEPTGSGSDETEVETMQDRIVRVSEDLGEIHNFYNISGSPALYAKLHSYYASELGSLAKVPFDSYTQDEKVDYLLLKNYLLRSQRNLELDRARDAEFAVFVEPFANTIRKWVAIRQRQDIEEVFDPKVLADDLSATLTLVTGPCTAHVKDHGKEYSKATGSRAVRRINELRAHLSETLDFYSGYHPSFDFWVSSPRSTLDGALAAFSDLVHDVIVGGGNDDDKTIVGEPIGREGLLVELEAEMIPYTPEELLDIAELEYAWCEGEMRKAAVRMGYEADDWRDALEHVKNLYEPPATHTAFVRSLVAEGARYVREHGLVTVPPLAEETITVTRIPPSQQLMAPFFLGGPRLQVAYPRADMAHADKLMSLRGNNRHFSRATAFHEMIPGHRLQQYVGARSSRAYRARLFDTPFFVEGWALYWEMVLWDRGDFFTSPEDRIGTMFWRMHRCVRITFSLGFHLGKLSPGECVELLVTRVGHERSTAEGEVRRSLNRSYSPLYQAGYMLGALQLMRLRREVLGEGKPTGKGRMGEKKFHDTILKANVMPIEMLRALIWGTELHEDFKSSWKFYGDGHEGDGV
ncbi:hypothetical protein F5Y17DRAFT_469192 [Xylariaceae sp. FL0594]|nr:hypothetical protein F5Y17DRAFT_469192 [Xylariaceae sp. FL0594]